MNIEELIDIVLINPQKKIKYTIDLKDSEGDIINLKETIENITEYILDKMKDEKGNSIQKEILPLMSRAMVAGLARLLGPDMAATMLTQEIFRHATIYMMTVGFALLKFLQKNDIKIATTEISITQDEIDTYQRLSRASSIMTAASSMGMSARDVITQLVSDGALTADDLVHMGIDGETAEKFMSALPKDKEGTVN